MPQPNHKYTPDEWVTKFRKKYEQDDWSYDVESYASYKAISEKSPSLDYPKAAIRNILARWPGKEHLFK